MKRPTPPKARGVGMRTNSNLYPGILNAEVSKFALVIFVSEILLKYVFVNFHITFEFKFRTDPGLS